MRANAKIHFVELPGADLPETARFYTLAFGWRFCGFSDDVVQSDEPGVVGRWVKDPQHRLVQPRVMIYAEDLLLMERDVQIAGGVITRRIHRARGGLAVPFPRPVRQRTRGVVGPISRAARPLAGRPHRRGHYLPAPATRTGRRG